MTDPTFQLATPEPLDGYRASDVPVPARAAPGQRFVRRVHRLRTLGLGLGFLCVASVLRLHDAPAWMWAAAALNAFVWPHVAWWLAHSSADPVRSEFRSLLIDSVLGGTWIALMQFNLLPSVLLASMLTADKMAAAGTRYALRSVAAMILACAATSALGGFAVSIDSPMSVVTACLPLLIVYPVSLSAVLHRLGTKFAHQNRRLARLSATDELTELGNRRHGLAAAERALSARRRKGGPATVVMIDVDHLKTVNDRYGHPAGDELLQAVGEALQRCARATDTAARYAGDEFLLVLPETEVRGAEELAKRIRERLAATELASAPDWRCAVSFGAAEAPNDDDVERWIALADAALYRAKSEGRDRFMSVASEAEEPEEERRVAVAP
ncbi:MAG TPA: diguanylate cyclase [Casimicrobiaceae bacterium]|nr:diguanylate cyclase [Casimicrobiaceae bacterium]